MWKACSVIVKLYLGVCNPFTLLSILGSTTLNNPNWCRRYNYYRLLCSLPPVNWSRNLGLDEWCQLNHLRKWLKTSFMLNKKRCDWRCTPFGWAGSPLPRFMTFHNGKIRARKRPTHELVQISHDFERSPWYPFALSESSSFAWSNLQTIQFGKKSPGPGVSSWN